MNAKTARQKSQKILDSLSKKCADEYYTQCLKAIETAVERGCFSTTHYLHRDTARFGSDPIKASYTILADALKKDGFKVIIRQPSASDADGDFDGYVIDIIWRPETEKISWRN